MAFLAFILLLSLSFVRAVNAHDPFETTTKIIAYPDKIGVEMIMAQATALELFGARVVPDSGQPWTAKAKLNGLYQLSSGTQPLELRSASASPGIRGDAEGDWVFEFEYSQPRGDRLSVQAPYLEKLEQGYTGVVQVVDANTEQLLDIKVLHSADPRFEFNLPSPVRLTGTPSPQSDAPKSTSKRGARPFGLFLWVGIEHVILGYDHLLFLLGVLLACSGFRQVLGLLTTFTLAHSVTLTLAAFRLVPLANDIVEPFIAASIFIAAFWGRSLHARGLLLPMTFAFGLIHGLGFAAGLRALADTTNVRILSLVGFNLGVELGQICAAIVLLPLLSWARRSMTGKTTLDWAARAVGVVGATIFVLRVAGWG